MSHRRQCTECRLWLATALIAAAWLTGCSGKADETHPAARADLGNVHLSDAQRGHIQIREVQSAVFHRTIETTGVVTVEKKGNVVADRIHCGGLIVRGKVRGAVTSRGPVLIGPEADLIGDVTAPSMAVGAGAVLEGHYQIGAKNDHPE